MQWVWQKLCSINTNEILDKIFLCFVTVLSIIAFTKVAIKLEEKGWKWLPYLQNLQKKL